MARVLGITLARGGSKSVPRKNIRMLHGLPLLAYSILEAKQSKLIGRFLVSTDDSEIQQTAVKYGAEAPFLRPADLASDRATSVAALQHAVAWAEEDEGQHFDYVVELMATNPLKTVEDVDAAVTKLIQTGADSVIGVCRLEDHHPARIKKIVDDKIVDFCVPETSSRRQDLKPDAYIRNGSIYALQRDALMERGIRFGSENSRPLIMPPERSANIDSEVDFLLAEVLLQRNPRPYMNVGESGNEEA